VLPYGEIKLYKMHMDKIARVENVGLENAGVECRSEVLYEKF